MSENFKNPKLVYVFDGLCSWCYAFYDQLEKTLKENPNFQLQLVNGGMFIGEAKRHALDVIPAEHVHMAYNNVIERGHAEISDAYLNDLVVKKNYYLDSERLAIGECVFRDYERGAKTELEFVHATQRQMYVNGVDPNSDEYYTNVLPDFDIEPNEFIKKLGEPEFRENAIEDFKLARDLNVDAYPQLLMQTSEKDYFLIAKGYTEYPDLQDRINKVIEEVKNDDILD